MLLDSSGMQLAEEEEGQGACVGGREEGVSREGKGCDGPGGREGSLMPFFFENRKKVP